MSANLGELEGQRILKARQSDADRIAQQAREERILLTEQPRFFEAMANELAEAVRGFNSTMGLEGQDAVTFERSGDQIQVGKRSKPFFLRKIIHRERTNEVFMRTTQVTGYQKQENEQQWYFEIQHGELRLNYKNFVECADLLFKGIPDLFR